MEPTVEPQAALGSVSNDADCSIDSSPVIQATFRTVNEELLRLSLEAVVAGLETTQSALADHDSSLGRTTKKNRRWAEVLELDIRLMRRAKHGLRYALGWPDECDPIQ